MKKLTGILALYGFTDIADITLNFDIDDDDYNDIMETGPVGVKTTASGYDYSKDTLLAAMSDPILPLVYDYSVILCRSDRLYDKDGISVIGEVMVTNKDGETTMFLEVQNNTSETIYADIYDFSINDGEEYGYCCTSERVSAGKRAILDVTLEDIEESLETEHEDFQKVKFLFKAMTLDYDVLAEETLEISR